MKQKQIWPEPPSISLEESDREILEKVEKILEDLPEGWSGSVRILTLDLIIDLYDAKTKATPFHIQDRKVHGEDAAGRVVEVAKSLNRGRGVESE